MLTEYIKGKGLTVPLVAQQMGVRKQWLYEFGKANTPTAKSLNKVATAMTELGVPTTPLDLVPLFDTYRGDAQ